MPICFAHTQSIMNTSISPSLHSTPPFYEIPNTASLTTRLTRNEMDPAGALLPRTLADLQLVVQLPGMCTLDSSFLLLLSNFEFHGGGRKTALPRFIKQLQMEFRQLLSGDMHIDGSHRIEGGVGSVTAGGSGVSRFAQQ
eukprot:Gb_24804 [translate_table: standard]